MDPPGHRSRGTLCLSNRGIMEMIGHRLIGWALILALLLVVIAPAVSAQEPQQVPQVDPKMQPYVDALAYWFKSMGYKDWAERVDQALIAAPDQERDPSLNDERDHDEDADEPDPYIPQFPGAERIFLAGVPGSAWWCMCPKDKLPSTKRKADLPPRRNNSRDREP